MARCKLGWGPWRGRQMDPELGERVADVYDCVGRSNELLADSVAFEREERQEEWDLCVPRNATVERMSGGHCRTDD